jgi:hypothetical protein
MKKILSLVLVIALVLGSFSFAFATAPADVVDTNYEEAVEVLMALGVVNGYPDGTYKPERVVTRAEMAKLLVEALGYGQLAGGQAVYSDTSGHWAEGYIAIATGINLVQGYPDGTFKPEGTLTFDEAVTMILRALGYTDESLPGVWPIDYKIKALDLKLYADTTTQTGGANRGNVAIMLFNALEQKLVVIKDGVAELTAATLISKIGAFEPSKFISASDLENLESAIDLTPYLYQTIAYYKNAKGEVAYVSSVSTKTFAGEVVATSGSTITVKPATGDDKVFTTTGTPLFYNGVQATTKVATGLDTTGKAMVKVLYTEPTTGTYNVAGVVAWEVTVAKLVVNAYVANATTLDTVIALPKTLDNKVDLTKVTVVGDANAITAIAKNDVVYAYAAEATAKVKLEVVRDVVSGTLTEKSPADATNQTVVLGGVSLSNPKNLAFTLGNTYSVALGKDGKIFDILDTTVVAPANYAVVKATAPQTPGTFDAVVLGKIQALVSSGDLVVFEAVAGLTLPGSNAKITYTLNTTGQITTYSAINNDTDVSGTFNATFKLVDGKYLLNDDTIIFNLKAEEWGVLEASDLGANITASALFATDPNYIKVLYVTDKGSAGTATATYAVITGYSLVLDGVVVQKVTHYLDAMYPVVTNTTSENLVNSGHFNKLVSVTLNTDGKLTAVSAVATSYENATGAAVVGNLIKVDETFHEVAADVVVYLVEEGKVVGVGTMADVTAEKYVTVHKLGTPAKVQYIFVSETAMPTI